jgi:hypothetical protein
MSAVLDFGERLAAREATSHRALRAPLNLDGQTAAGPQRAEELISALAVELSGHIDSIGAVVTRRMLVAEQRLVDPDDPTLGPLVSRFSHSTAGAVLAALAYGSSTERAGPTQAALALFERLAESDEGLAIALRAHRLLAAELWETWAAFIEDRIADRSLHRSVLSISTRQMSAYLDSVCDQLTDAWPRTRGRRRRGIDLPVQELVRRALYGSPGVAAAALADLGYTAACHMAIAVAFGDDQDKVEALARRLKLACGASTLVEPGSADVATIWLGFTRSVTALDVERARPLLDVGSVVGMSEVAAGVEGFRRTRQHATDALRVGIRTGRRGVTEHRDVALLALLCADESRADALARAELGPLAENNETAARLRETLSVYLEAGESQVVTAERLFVHQKTVKYRLHQAEELLGHTIAERRFELVAALMIREALHS